MQMELKWDVVVIGGGPAGMMAAGRAGERGLKVLLLEKNPHLGKKLLITGGGRCNVTNNKPDDRLMLAKYKDSDKFLFSAFAQFSVAETLSFFNNRGMATKEENEGRIFPVSNGAKSVLDVLVDYMKEGGVKIETGQEVISLAVDNESNIIIKTKGSRAIAAKSCIIATGGMSHPETGSTGAGFRWLKKLDHEIIDNSMSLVPIALKDSWVKKVSGVALKDIKLSTFKNGAKQKSYKGKILFTHFGISGPLVLNMSNDVGKLLLDTEGSEYTPNKKTAPFYAGVTIVMDLFPNLDSGTLKQKLQTLLTEQSNKQIKNALIGFAPSALANIVLELAQIDGETPNHSVRTEQRKALVALLKSIPLDVAGLLGKDKAVVSSGGVVLNQVNFKTMQSRIVPQLYLVGDILNIDRPSGGYSLQLCWTTGFLAGNSC